MESESEFSSMQKGATILSIPELLHYQVDYPLTLVPTLIPILSYTFAAVTLSVIWYFLFWRPLNRTRDISDFGYDDVKANYPDVHNQKIVIDRLRRQKKICELPPVYPNGWFGILETDELPRKSTKQIEVLGLNLLAWRGLSGKSYVTDAHSNELEANLTMDAEVNGEDVVYSSKGWKLSVLEKKLKTFTNQDSTAEGNDLANIKLWETMEMNGFIYLWFHAEGEFPNWRPPVYPQIESGNWKYVGRTEYKVTCHIQEIPENAADLAHFNVVHEPALLTGGKPKDSLFKWSFLSHVWSAGWAACEEPGNKYLSVMKLHHDLRLFNKITLVKQDFETHQLGPGMVLMEYNGLFGHGILFLNMTPVEPLLQKLTSRFYSSKSTLHPFGMFLLLFEAITMERDIAIWNRKTYISRPLLTKEEKTIKSFRGWYSRFYSENSPKHPHTNIDVQI